MKLIVDIKKNFPGFNLDLAFETRNGILGLLGESGSGKSMILRCIAGLVKPDYGKIILNGETLFDSDKNINLPIKNRKIGFLFQNYALFPHMTVEKNISYALTNFSKSERNKIVHETLKVMQLEDFKKRYPHQLSGGQQQRVALARALAIAPKALFLDEPFSALDNHLRNIMIKQMMETLNSYNGPTLFVTHNLEEAYQLCDDIIILSQGKIQAKGCKKDIFNNPPSLCAAKITGCKNISPVKLTEADSLEAANWNCSIKPMKSFDKKTTHIGIRAHYLQLTEEDGINIFNCWPAYTSETPFRVFVYLKVNNIPTSISDYNLVWDISSEEYEVIKNKPYPWKIHLNEDKFIFINEK